MQPGKRYNKDEIFPNEVRGENSINIDDERKKEAKKLRVQKFPNLEVGISMGYECVFKKVSLSHGKKSPTVGSFQILSATTHLVILFSFVYISHNNTYILVTSKGLISEQFLYFKNEWCENVPKTCIILRADREALYLLWAYLLTLYSFSKESWLSVMFFFLYQSHI